MMKEWRYIKPLKDEKLILEAEKKLDFEFNKAFIAFVKKFNGGRPPVSVFDTKSTKERTIKSFLSLNPDDPEDIITLNKNASDIFVNLIAFAIDNFGNYICFERNSESVIFLDYETGNTEFIANNFNEFIYILNGRSITK
ncbi:MAG: SMI1/KNR4 family protein [Bacteroidales bacterium]